MTRVSKSIFLLGAAVLALNACSSTKGPGEIGSKNDIVVRNKGIPGAEVAATPPVKAQGEDFTSTVEQAEAVPAPVVAEAEPLPDNSPAMEQAVQAQEEATAPVPSETTQQSAVPATADAAQVSPTDAVIPEEPVTESVTPPVDAAIAAEPTPSASIYPATDYPAPAPAQTSAPVAPEPAPTAAAPTTPSIAPTTAPAASVYTPAPESLSGKNYPLDPNAPYSPKAIAAAAAASSGAVATETQLSPSGINLADPAIIRSVQAALASKSLYTGPQTGVMDAGLLNAISQYQAANGLALSGLNEDTLKHLGIIE